MAQYLSPGVYVEEVPSAEKAIAGVGTSTAAFIGIVPDAITVPIGSKLVRGEPVGEGGTDGEDEPIRTFTLQGYPVATEVGRFEVRVDGDVVDGVTLANEEATSTATLTFPEGVDAPAEGAVVSGDFVYDYTESSFAPVAAGIPKLCTTFADFKKLFGDFSLDGGQRALAHAVYGFFNNGGTRCYVARVTGTAGIQGTLDRMAAIDEIALVAIPGISDETYRGQVVDSCVKATDRFAILDCAETLGAETDPDLTLLDPSNAANVLPSFSDFAAFYFPWIQVFDPATKIRNPLADGLVYVPPSGHMAGIYARVDTARGVHKAPANEVVRGALGLRYQISKAQQNGLNPQGVNCIRDLNGAIRVWGARTIGGNVNADLKYINVRRTLLFLRESIDEGTQWVVFEPNEPGLWQKITRNITAFLSVVWRSGALFGTTQQQAFYVKCDAETNPPELRELGRVVTEIGVSIVRPAEFVIFRISQFTAPGK
jgi:phage tail sheath protein FI